MPHAPTTLTIPADVAELEQLDAVIQTLVASIPQATNPEMLAYALLLAVHEACVNIIVHAYADRDPAAEPGQIRIQFGACDDPPRIEVELWDEGDGFDDTAVVTPEPGTVQEHGYGIFLMRELLDDIQYERTASTNHWTLVKHVD